MKRILIITLVALLVTSSYSACQPDEFQYGSMCFKCSDTRIGIANCNDCCKDEGCCKDAFFCGYKYSGAFFCRACSGAFFLERNSCQACHGSCATCSGPLINNCLSCTAGKFYLSDKTCSACPEGKYESSDNTCQGCNYSCQICNGPGNTNCQSCKFNFFLKGSSCLSKDECFSAGGWLSNNLCLATCPESFYGDSFRVCKQCHSTCLTCSGPEINKCLSCSKNLNTPYLHENQCLNNCPEGFFKNPKDSKCYQTCPSPLIGQILSQTCEENCAKSEYRDNLDRICKGCDSTCATCSVSSKNCTSCPSFLFQDGNSCVEICPEPFWGNNSTQKCECKCTNNAEFGDALGKRVCRPCNKYCATCSGSETNCTSCILPKFLSNTTCVETCQEPNWGNNDTAKCEASCTNPNEYGDESGKRVCRACDKSCATCSNSATNCTSCTINRFLFESSCFEICPEPTWGSRSTGKCELKCANPNDFGDKLGKRICQPCDKSCASCLESANNCLSCAANLFLLGSSCVKICPKPTWGNNSTTMCEDRCTNPNEFGDESGKRVCKPCNENCATCSFLGNNCTSCSGDKFLSGSECVEICPEPTWGNNSTKKCESKCTNPNEFGDKFGKRICKPCDKSCAACLDSATNCRSCSALFFASGSACLTSCPIPTWGNNNTKKCVDSCLNPNEYGDIADRICKPCLNNCAKCEIKDTCIECYEGYYLKSSSNTNIYDICISNCPASFSKGAIEGRNSPLCQACSSSKTDILLPPLRQVCKSCSEVFEGCRECSTTEKCDSCLSSHFFYQSKCIPDCQQKDSQILDLKNARCISKCDDGHFEKFDAELKQKTCTLCPSECELCKNEKECTFCRLGFVIIEGTKCGKTCPPGSNPNWIQRTCSKCKDSEFPFIQEGKTVCSQCQAPCRSCTGNPKNCTSCIPPLLWNGTDCAAVCELGKYPIHEFGVCGKCHSMCKSCNWESLKSCLECENPRFLFKGECVEKCPDLYFQDITARECKACDVTCSKCLGPKRSQCLDCAKARDFIPFNNSNIDEFTIGECVCKPRFFENREQVCEACHFSCANCTGPGLLECGHCVANRGDKYHKPFAGRCTCPANTFDYLEDTCKDIGELRSIVNLIYAQEESVKYTAISSLIGFGGLKMISVLSHLIEITQEVNLYSFLNIGYPVNLESFLNFLSKFRFYTNFKFFTFENSELNTREANNQIPKAGETNIFKLKGISDYFLKNCLSTLIILFTTPFFFLVVCRLVWLYLRQNKLLEEENPVGCLSRTLTSVWRSRDTNLMKLCSILLLGSLQEMHLFAILQVSKFNSNSVHDKLNFAFSIFWLFCEMAIFYYAIRAFLASSPELTSEIRLNIFRNKTNTNIPKKSVDHSLRPQDNKKRYPFLFGTFLRENTNGMSFFLYKGLKKIILPTIYVGFSSNIDSVIIALSLAYFTSYIYVRIVQPFTHLASNIAYELTELAQLAFFLGLKYYSKAVDLKNSDLALSLGLFLILTIVVIISLSTSFMFLGFLFLFIQNLKSGRFRRNKKETFDVKQTSHNIRLQTVHDKKATIHVDMIEVSQHSPDFELNPGIQKEQESPNMEGRQEKKYFACPYCGGPKETPILQGHQLVGSTAEFNPNSYFPESFNHPKSIEISHFDDTSSWGFNKRSMSKRRSFELEMSSSRTLFEKESVSKEESRENRNFRFFEIESFENIRKKWHGFQHLKNLSLKPPSDCT